MHENNNYEFDNGNYYSIGIPSLTTFLNIPGEYKHPKVYFLLTMVFLCNFYFANILYILDMNIGRDKNTMQACF